MITPVVAPNQEQPAAEFNARQFLDDFRETVLETGQSAQGSPSDQERPFIDTITNEAETKAHDQLDRLIDLLPADQAEVVTDHAKEYVNNYSRMAKILGLISVRLAKKGNASFSTVLEDKEKRGAVLDALARDYRRTAWYRADKDVSALSDVHLSRSFPLYHSPSYLELLQDYYGDEVNRGELNGVLANFVRDPEARLDQAIAKHKELSTNPTYSEVDPGVLRAMVFSHLEPESALDTYLAKLDELSQNPDYIALGTAVIKEAIHRNPKNPEARLDKIVTKFQELTADPRYADITDSTIKRILTHSHRSDPEKILDAGIAKTKELLENPEYAELGAWAVRRIVFFHPTNPEGLLDTAAAKYAELRQSPVYKGLPTSTLIMAATAYNDSKDFLDSELAAR